MSEKLKDLIWFVKPENEDIGELFIRLAEYASHVTAAKEIKLSFNTDKAVSESKLSISQKFHLFLSAKEAIAKAINHSNADKLIIAIKNMPNHFSIQIIDNGKGIDSSNLKKGNGLNNMTKRLQSINGKVSFIANEPTGLIVKFEVPYDIYKPD